jgi:hypothetical protein
MVWLPEAEVVAAYLSRPENAGARAAFLEAFPAWRAGTGDADRKAADLTFAGKVTEHVEVLYAHWRNRVMCAFNQDGLCSVYEARPLACRTAHALDTADYCRGDDEARQRVTGLRFPPLDDYLDPASGLTQAMHNALGAPTDRTVALCQAVHDLLTAPPATP